tara:strand:- start:215 stop:940 length:726 start_codon:yes stop_codon:yes gene_type:complete
MKAIICAAGRGRRMGSFIKKIPKSLLSLGDKTLIENLIFALSIETIDEIIILTGYLENKIKNKLGYKFNGKKISYVTNKLFSETNNMYSLFLSKDKIDDDIIFISGDVYLGQSIVKEFITSPNPNSILIDTNPDYFSDNDPVKVTIVDNKITSIDKKLPLYETNGVAVGAYKMSYVVFLQFLDIAEGLIEEGFVEYGYIEPIKFLLKKHDYIPHLIGGEIWCDIDTPEEYSAINNIMRHKR